MIDTIFVMGTMMMFSVSLENIRDPILITIQVKIVLENCSWDSVTKYFLVSKRA